MNIMYEIFTDLHIDKKNKKFMEMMQLSHVPTYPISLFLSHIFYHFPHVLLLINFCHRLNTKSEH